MDDSYTYQPLLEGHIRLLEILPADDQVNRLEGALKEVRLTEDMVYETLSYTWGESDAIDGIYVQGKRIALTPNCSNAVRNIRGTNASRTIWIDAICINQADGLEKSRQVSMMGHIYAFSQRTIVYLGAGDGTTHTLRNKLQTKPGALGYSSPDLDNGIETARNHLLERPWYHRKWIIQEVLLSKEVTLQAGQHEFSWAELETLDNQNLEIIKIARKYLHPSSMSSMQVNGRDWDPKAKAAYEDMLEQGEVVPMKQQRITGQANLPRYSKYRSPQLGFLMPPQLFDVLCMTSNFSCKEPRDRLFAVLSLFARKPDIPLDYTCDEQHIYNCLTKELLSLGDSRMFWLEDRDSWRPNWASALSTLADFVKRRGAPDRVSRPATDIGRSVKEAQLEKRAGLDSEPRDRVWKVGATFLGRISKVASQPFDNWTASDNKCSSGSGACSQAQWESILQSLDMDGATENESGIYPLSQIHQRNRFALEWYRLWTLDLLGRRNDFGLPQSDAEIEAIGRATSHHQGHLTFCRGMRMFVCETGLLGVADQSVRTDDVVYFLPGHTCPFVVLRPMDFQWRLIGLAWHGPLKLFPCCFSGHGAAFFSKDKCETLEII